MSDLIASVVAIPAAYVEPNDAGGTRHVCLVKLTTAEGRIGWGEAITMWPSASKATANLIDGLRELVIGRSPTDVEDIWRTLKEETWWYGHGGGMAAFAIAAIDIALWDLRGKIEDANILQLMGGRTRGQLPAIASIHAFRPGLHEMAEEIGGWLSSDYRGIKIGFGKRGEARLGYDAKRDVKFLRLVREQVGGDALVAIDIGNALRWTVDVAVARAQLFAEFDIAWLEEPLGGWNPAGYRELHERTDVVLGAGEREWQERGFAQLIDSKDIGVIGCDPGRAEGITGFLRVAQLCERAGVIVNAHAWSTAIVTAASLACSFATHAARVFELKPLPNPMQDALVAKPIHSVGGYMEPLELPGLGIEIDEEFVKSCRL